MAGALPQQPSGVDLEIESMVYAASNRDNDLSPMMYLFVPGNNLTLAYKQEKTMQLEAVHSFAGNVMLSKVLQHCLNHFTVTHLVVDMAISQ